MLFRASIDAIFTLVGGSGVMYEGLVDTNTLLANIYGPYISRY